MRRSGNERHIWEEFLDCFSCSNMLVPIMEEERLPRTEAADTAVTEVRSIAPVRMPTRIFLLLFFIARSFLRSLRGASAPCTCVLPDLYPGLFLVDGRIIPGHSEGQRAGL